MNATKRALLCWKYHRCKRTRCPARDSGNRPCWLLEDTLCHTGEAFSASLKFERYCLTCAVYRSAARKAPHGSLVRVALYLQAVEALRRTGVVSVSSRYLGSVLKINPGQIRKDLSEFGVRGDSGSGYNATSLENRLRAILELDDKVPAVMIGRGDCSRLLLSNPALSGERGVAVLGVFAPDQAYRGGKLGVGDHVVRPFSKLASFLAARQVRIAVVATMETPLAHVFDVLRESQVRTVLNFSPQKMEPTPDVRVFEFNLPVVLDTICYYHHHNDIPVLPENALL